MSDEIHYLDATELAKKIRTKELSPVEVTESFLKRIEEVNPKLNAVVTLVENAMDRARAAEQAVIQKKNLGLLHGVPFTIKDCVDTEGIRTTRGSKFFERHIPARDATAVSRLKDAGGILLGKTNMPEFALWWETDNLVFGRTNNPWNLERTSGGSSGGEAAGLASGMTPLGIGSDLGGSIRQPASFCGVVGIKPTHGRVPLTGHWPETLLGEMHVGPLARTARDAALALRIISGPDGFDPYVAPVPMPKIPKTGEPLPKLRVGFTREIGFSPVSQDVQDTVTKAASALADLGCRVEEYPLDFLEEDDPQAITAAIYTAEPRAYLENVVKGKHNQLHSNMQKRMKVPMPSFDEYLKAREGWETVKQKTIDSFRQYDVLLCPTAPMPAYPHSQQGFEINGTSVPSRHALRGTVPWDLTGSPAISVPFGWSSGGLPIGVQLVGRHFDETTLLHVAAALETTTDAGKKHPPL